MFRRFATGHPSLFAIGVQRSIATPRLWAEQVRPAAESSLHRHRRRDALAFDFTNGFHDTANAMATTIATRALPPKVAVALAGVLNAVGAFLSLKLAATIAEGIVKPGAATPAIIFASAGGLVVAAAVGLVVFGVLEMLSNK